MNIEVLTDVVARQAGRNEEAELYYKRSVELRPNVSCQSLTFVASAEMSVFNSGVDQ